MTYEDLKEEVFEALKTKPSDWRDGQFVFNYIDEKYVVARIVQFVYNIYCFYDDSCINEFIAKSCEMINELDKSNIKLR